MASRRIEARRIGSPETDRTLIRIGPHPEAAVRLNELHRTIDSCDTNLRDLLHALGLRTVDRTKIKRLIECAPTVKKRNLEAQERELNGLVASKEEATRALRKLEAEIDKGLLAADIRATETAFSEVEIQFGKLIYRVPENHRQPVFVMAPDGSGIRVRAD